MPFIRLKDKVEILLLPIEEQSLTRGSHMITHLALKENRKVSQTAIKRSSSDRLPTMYDLPSEDPEEPGLPDDFHYYQPQLLRETFCPPNYPFERFYVATDLNLYYDVHHPTWYKRPDWMAVLDIPHLYEGHDMRMSYVIWQEKVAPFLVVELLSEGTEKEDLGQTLREIQKPPTKWQVYEQILQVPYYVVFSRDPDKFQVFQLRNRRYHEFEIKEKQLWFLEIDLGLGLWQGRYQGIHRKWLRWYDANGKWIPTPAEQAKQEKQRAEKLVAQLKALGIEPNI